MERGVLVEKPISPQLIVVGSILRQNSTQLRFTQFFGPDIAGLSAAFPCGPVTRLNLRVVRFAEIGRCEQSYTDADARSAHTHQYRALPSHQTPTHECPRALAGLVIGWPLSSVA